MFSLTSGNEFQVVTLNPEEKLRAVFTAGVLKGLLATAL